MVDLLHHQSLSLKHAFPLACMHTLLVLPYLCGNPSGSPQALFPLLVPDLMKGLTIPLSHPLFTLFLHNSLEVISSLRMASQFHTESPGLCPRLHPNLHQTWTLEKSSGSDY